MAAPAAIDQARPPPRRCADPHDPTRARRVVTARTDRDKSVGTKLEVLAGMLRAPTWRRLPLTLNWVLPSAAKHFSAHLQPPEHMAVTAGPIRRSTLGCSDPHCECAAVDAGDTDAEAEEEEEGEEDGVMTGGGTCWGGGGVERGELCVVCDAPLTGAEPWLACAKPPCPRVSGGAAEPLCTDRSSRARAGVVAAGAHGGGRPRLRDARAHGVPGRVSPERGWGVATLSAHTGPVPNVRNDAAVGRFGPCGRAAGLKSENRQQRLANGAAAHPLTAAGNERGGREIRCAAALQRARPHAWRRAD